MIPDNIKAQFQQILGKPIPAQPVSPATQSFSDKIGAIGKAAAARANVAPVPSASVISTANNVGADMGANMANEYKGAANDFTSGVQSGAEKYGAGVAQANQSKTLGGEAMGELKATGGLIGSAADSAIAGGRALFAPVSAAIKTGIDQVSNSETLQGFANSPEVKGALDYINGLGDKLGTLASAHPDVAKNISRVLQTALLAVGGGEGDAVLQGDLGATAKGIAGDVAQGAKTVASGAADLANTNPAFEGGTAAAAPKVTAPTGEDLQAIHEMITPKPTVKEARLAMDQGRLYNGKDPGLFTEGGGTKVAASPQQAKSSFTIANNIPDAAKMDEPTLYSAIKDKVGDMAEALKPEMAKVPVNEATVEKITSDWTDVKKSQMEEAPASEEKNVAKRQAKFESFLKKSQSGTMQDLWDTRQSYDDTVPANVKQASDLSSDSLQQQKSEWLQNRRILTDAINDPDNGLGETSRSAFSNMTDLYEAKNGILSKAKINAESTPSILSKALNSKGGKIAKNVAAGVGLGTGLYETAKHL